jgi:hypothetical protein
VPETYTALPTRTARENPISGSYGEEPAMFRRIIGLSLASRNFPGDYSPFDAT